MSASLELRDSDFGLRIVRLTDHYLDVGGFGVP